MLTPLETYFMHYITHHHRHRYPPPVRPQPSPYNFIAVFDETNGFRVIHSSSMSSSFLNAHNVYRIEYESIKRDEREANESGWKKNEAKDKNKGRKPGTRKWLCSTWKVTEYIYNFHISRYFSPVNNNILVMPFYTTEPPQPHVPHQHPPPPSLHSRVLWLFFFGLPHRSLLPATHITSWNR